MNKWQVLNPMSPPTHHFLQRPLLQAQVNETWNPTTEKIEPKFNKTVLTTEFWDDKTEPFEDGHAAFPTKRRLSDAGC